MNATAVVGFGLLALLAGPTQTYKVAVDGVRVDVLVADGRRAVRGLTAADFELRDRGVAQRIDSVSFEDVPLSLMIVLETSASVRGAPPCREAVPVTESSRAGAPCGRRRSVARR